MRFIAGPLNKQLLQNLLGEVIESCTRVRAAVAYASRDNMKLFEACAQHLKPLEFFGRYDHTVAVDPAVLKWFLDKASPNFDCKLVPDILHAKVIWWVDAGAYIGSANLADRAWISNIEAGTFLPHDELVETGMERELQRFFEEVDDRARPLTKEIYQEQLRLADRRSELSKREYGLEQQFDKDRLLPKNQGLVFVDTKRSSEKRFQKFEQEWNDTLQVMRSIASRVSAPGAKPGWIDASVAPGVQADQFLHAYSRSRMEAVILTRSSSPGIRRTRNWRCATRWSGGTRPPSTTRLKNAPSTSGRPGCASCWRAIAFSN